jgi:hypothetical protein
MGKGAGALAGPWRGWAGLCRTLALDGRGSGNGNTVAASRLATTMSATEKEIIQWT